MRLVYVTTESVAQAETIGRHLIAQELAACVNILPGMKSIYRWQGRIEEAQEAVLLVKTKSTLTDAVVKEVKKTHSYQVPCAIVIPVEGGNPDYFTWITSSCR